jgi:hypothetical protein
MTQGGVVSVKHNGTGSAVGAFGESQQVTP